MLTCLHDYASPGSAVAVLRLQALVDAGVRIAFEGFEPLPVDAAAPVTLDVLADLRRWAPVAEDRGLRMRRPSRLPVTARAHLVGALATDLGLGASWRTRAYTALWRDDLDLADVDVLTRLAAEAGLPPGRARTVAEDDAAVRRFRRAAARRRGAGVGGVPVLDAGGTLVSAMLGDAEVRQLAGILDHE